MYEGISYEKVKNKFKITLLASEDMPNLEMVLDYDELRGLQATLGSIIIDDSSEEIEKSDKILKFKKKKWFMEDD